MCVNTFFAIQPFRVPSQSQARVISARSCSNHCLLWNVTAHLLKLPRPHMPLSPRVIPSQWRPWASLKAQPWKGASLTDAIIVRTYYVYTCNGLRPRDRPMRESHVGVGQSKTEVKRHCSKSSSLIRSEENTLAGCASQH